ncbi:hypothetical protein AWB78_01342 [Caballeronia calidae]|uniref:Uncharacterized protein n=1 Tax=Caballeronia calidae TaxID=1777139 RepID=A0A158A7D8_9BURK|nr:hypothetical protein [Caballeronia calidae]SAK53605.1 hypothetical protein AWB78_01342 [Caballeronia calidae]
MSLSDTVSAAFRSTYDLAFQISPIILNGGIVAGTLGGMMPIIGLNGQLTSLASSVLTGGGLSLDDFYARFVPLPGSAVISNAIGTYPFANQQVAANAIITQPRHVSMMMIAPVKDASGYLSKLALFTALQTSLQAHCNAGGTFHVATPSFLFTDCLLTSMTDVTTGESKQQQIQWQLDFVKPLVTQQAALAAYNGLMGKIAGGAQVLQSSAAGTSIWSSAVAAAGSAVQGAVPGITGMSGAVNTFLSQPS